jgi:ribonuclease HII
MFKWLIGIDEVGRGPLAGPVGVGVVLVPADFDWERIKGVGDSKKITPKNREAIFRRAEDLKHQQIIDYSVTLVSALTIDKIGIVPSIKQAMSESLNKVTVNLNFEEVSVKLDGGLKAPIDFLNQETIIKGDSKELVIGLASVLAKVIRDTYMENLAQNKDFSIYEFAKHKGYGTKKHRELILSHGLSYEHRRSFCKNILNFSKIPL